MAKPLRKPIAAIYTRSDLSRRKVKAPLQDTLFLGARQFDANFRNVTFHVFAYTEKRWLEIGDVRLMALDDHGEPLYLNRLATQTKKWNLQFPLSVRYISLGLGYEYYKRLFSIFDRERLIVLLSDLHDYVVLKRFGADSYNLSLQTSPHFEKRFLRGTSSRRTLDYASSLLFTDEYKTLSAESTAQAFSIRFQLDGFLTPHEITYDFSRSEFPSTVNAMIGANGAGKTQALLHLADYLTETGAGDPKQVAALPFAPIEPLVPFNQVILASFSPFENVKRSLERNRRDVDYAAITFRDRSGRYSLTHALDEMATALLSILSVDRKEFLPDFPGRMKTLWDVLQQSISFDDIEVLPVSADTKGARAKQPRKYSLRRAMAHKNPKLTLRRPWTVRFVRDGKPLRLSSGQLLFFMLMTALVSIIRTHSLILIDELELFLHPNLEIAGIRMLKMLLKVFESYAIVATHSSIIVREIPSQCVSVIRRTLEGIPLVERPSFQTFGADLSRLVNYVFDGAVTELPFQEWLIAEFGDKTDQQLLDTRDLNLESISYLRNTRPGSKT